MAEHAQMIPPSTDAVEIPHDEFNQPDLQAFIRACGERHAQSIGEKYSIKHDGGYRSVRSVDWRARDAAVSHWRLARRDALISASPREAAMVRKLLLQAFEALSPEGEEMPR